MNGLSGTFQLVSLRFTSSSSTSLPLSTRLSAPTAATGLLTEPAWNSVCGVTGIAESARATP
jgi:hypothetical protein